MNHSQRRTKEMMNRTKFWSGLAFFTVLWLGVAAAWAAQSSNKPAAKQSASPAASEKQETSEIDRILAQKWTAIWME
jgi:hypothetical protein